MHGARRAVLLEPAKKAQQVAKQQQEVEKWGLVVGTYRDSGTRPTNDSSSAVVWNGRTGWNV